MKKLGMIIVLGLLVMSFASAGKQIYFDGYDVAMDSTDTHEVRVCIDNVDEGGITPIEGAPIEVFMVCKDVDASGDCLDPVDVQDPVGFSVSPMLSATGADGCSTLTIESDNAENGVYAYHVSADGNPDAEQLGIVEIGSVSIPEFTAIGAGIAMLGAGAVYMFKKRK